MKEILKKIDYIKVIQLLVVTVMVFAPLFAVEAQGLRPIQCPPGIRCTNETSINDLIYTVITWLLGIAFGVAVLFLIIGGFWYITSAGNEDQAAKGKSTALNAIIGIVIIVLSYVIVNVVANALARGGGTTAP